MVCLLNFVCGLGENSMNDEEYDQDMQLDITDTSNVTHDIDSTNEGKLFMLMTKKCI